MCCEPTQHLRAHTHTSTSIHTDSDRRDVGTICTTCVLETSQSVLATKLCASPLTVVQCCTHSDKHCVCRFIDPTLDSTGLVDKSREPPFAFNLSMIVCVLQFANVLGFYPGLHRPTSRVIHCHGSSWLEFCLNSTARADSAMYMYIVWYTKSKKPMTCAHIYIIHLCEGNKCGCVQRIAYCVVACDGTDQNTI